MKSKLQVVHLLERVLFVPHLSTQVGSYRDELNLFLP